MPLLVRLMVVALLAPMLGVGGLGGASNAAGAEQPRRVTITLTVVGCADCDVQAVQNKNADLTFSTPLRTVTGDRDTIRFTVPAARTHKMAFLVYAPFDELAQGGIPAVTVTAFRAKRVGATVSARYAGVARKASGCWSGTDARRVSHVLRVRKVRVRDSLLGPGRHTIAAAYLKQTLASRPYWVRAGKNALHASDPSICR